MANGASAKTQPGDHALTVFSDGEEAASALAIKVADQLRDGLAERGKANLLASGGSTPKRLYQALSSTDLDWSRVTIVLADERWVEPGQEGSNETFLKTHLVTGCAAKAHFIGLKTGGANPAAALDAIETRLGAVDLPFDAAVLGMGTDGHTLSWFPQAEGLSAALAITGPRVAAITARPSEVTGAFTQRATLTKASLVGTRLCLLLLNGAAKRATWEAASKVGPTQDMPVRALVHDRGFDLTTCWWP